MKKKFISLLLIVSVMVSMLCVTSITAYAASAMKASEDLITVLKAHEGFLEKPIQDYTQYSVGYGSYIDPASPEYAKYLAEGITEEEADALLRQYVAVAETAVNKMIDTYGLTMTQNQFDALISFSYNCGTSWMSSDGTFRSAVINGKTGVEFLNAIIAWCKAGDKILGGLITRRLSEANMYLNGVYATSAPAEYCYVIYNAKGGYCSKVIQAYMNTEEITELPAATRSGYNFLGWFTASSGGTQVTKLDTSTHKRNLFAQWEKIGGEEPAPETPEETLGTPVNYQAKVQVTNSLNVREEPNTGSDVVQTLYNNDVVTIVAELQATDYLWGKLSDGGWIALKYTVKLQSTTPETPPATETPEAGTPDAGTPDAGTPDAGTPDAGTPDAGTPDAGTPDAGTPDAGTPDAGTPETPEQPAPTPEPTPEPAPLKATVTASGLNVRSNAGTGYPVLRSLRRGQEATLTEVKAVDGHNWGKLTEGGWICLTYTNYAPAGSGTTGTQTPTTPDTQTPTTPSAGVTVTVNTAVNVRTGAGTAYGISKVVYRGQTVTIVETKTAGGYTWGRLSTGGWIALKYTNYSTVSAGTQTTPTPTPTVPDSGTAETPPATGTTTPGTGTTPPASDTTTPGTGTTTGTAGIVTASNLTVRGAPSITGAVIGTLKRGDPVQIVSQKFAEGMTWGQTHAGTWVCMNYVNISGNGQTVGGTYTVTASAVNIRNGAGTTYAVIGSMRMGQQVTIVETTTVGGTRWGKTSTGGWISMKYLG